MRRFLCFLIPFLLLATSSHAAGWPKAKGGDPRGLTREITGGEAATTMRIMGNLPWLPQGKGGEQKKYLYVIYTPTCEFSQGMYNSLGNITDDVEIRWIPIDPAGSINSMYEERTAETVRRAFKSSQVPPDGDVKKSANINTYTMAAISYLLTSQMLSPDGNLYFPTLIYGTPEKASITIGPVKDLKKIVASLQSSDQPATPEAVTLGALKTEVLPVPAGTMLANKGTETMAMRLAPDANAIRIGGIPAGGDWPLPVAGVTKNGYVAFKISSGGAPIFVEAPEFAQSFLKKN